MSSMYELYWDSRQLEIYDTDKLYFILNAYYDQLKNLDKLKARYPKQMWFRLRKQTEKELQQVRDIIHGRPDKMKVRKEWLKHHHNFKENHNQCVNRQELEEKVILAGFALDCFIEFEDIEIYHFNQAGRPMYYLPDFKDILPENVAHNGFEKQGITKNQWLKIHPIGRQKLLNLLDKADVTYYAQKEGHDLITYPDAVDAKRILVDKKTWSETFWD
ncbi:hypothetical protein [Lactobacillus sp.]|uniref:hypothetical protein n=1 Tax=Lactobacillus sp. TaxID=1591 RepID=UPI001990C402|nr:hypothetical protein [Lactobacillus sp.]MBD5429152.1 hypothetical protein [Lactobacillus sp.]